MGWRIPDSRSRTPRRRIKNAPIQPPKEKKVDWRIPDSRSRTPHRRIKNVPIQLKGSPPHRKESGLAHSRFSLANAAPENQECAHPTEGVSLPKRKKSGLAHSRFSLANAAPENQECAHPAESVSPPHRKKWIGAFPILARERRAGESRIRPSN